MVMTGNTQAIHIDSQPSGAQCTLIRQGQILGVVLTPAQISLRRSSRAIKVICRKTDYQDTGQFLIAEGEPLALGNVAVPFVGLLGSVADSASGADRRYPENLKVWLVPSNSAADTANMAPALAAAASAFNGRYFGKFRSTTIFGSVESIQIDVQVVAGRGTGTAKSDACAVPGELSLAVDPSGAVVGRFQLMDGNRQWSVMTFTGLVMGDHMTIKIVQKVQASLVKQP
jgi:hypothetical protein